MSKRICDRRALVEELLFESRIWKYIFPLLFSNQKATYDLDERPWTTLTNNPDQRPWPTFPNDLDKRSRTTLGNPDLNDPPTLTGFLLSSLLSVHFSFVFFHCFSGNPLIKIIYFTNYLMSRKICDRHAQAETGVHSLRLKYILQLPTNYDCLECRNLEP